MPLILNGVARQAETVEDMQRVTMNGPIRFGLPFSITVRCASKRFLRRGAARAGDQAGALVRDVALLEAGVGDRLLHREEGDRRRRRP